MEFALSLCAEKHDRLAFPGLVSHVLRKYLSGCLAQQTGSVWCDLCVVLVSGSLQACFERLALKILYDL